jgi:hypothetical protein
MVETITPVVHGGRTRRWASALVLHLLGATVAAAAFGAALGAVGRALGAPWGTVGIGVVVVLAAVYLAREAFGVRVPVPELRRQVPDWWRTFFGFGPAAFLYGAGLGVGFLTFLGHGTLLVVATAAVASGSPFLGAALVAPFAIARGIGTVVAARTTTQDDGTALIGRLAASSSWIGWRSAHAIALGGVLVVAVAGIVGSESFGDVGGVAAAALSAVFAWAAVSKLVRSRAWRRALSSYGLAQPIRRVAGVGVPLVELGVAALPFVGLRATAGAVALVVLAAFSVAVVVARLRSGRRLDCACFGGARARDYRVLLARNAVLAIVAAVAWREGGDSWIGAGMRPPTAGEYLPGALVAIGLALGTWVVVTAVSAIRRRAV